MELSRTLAAAIVAVLLALGGPALAATPANTANVIACAHARALPAALTAAQRAQLDAIVARYRANDMVAADTLWRAFATQYFTKATAADAPQVQRWVVREAVLEPDAELALAADHVRFLSEQKQEVDAMLRDLRALRPVLTTATATRQARQITLTPTFSKGAAAISSRSTRTMTASQVDAAVAQLKSQSDSLSGLTEQMSLRLQLAMDRRAQVIQTLSNILKKVSSTSETIIGNLK